MVWVQKPGQDHDHAVKDSCHGRQDLLGAMVVGKSSEWPIYVDVPLNLGHNKVFYQNYSIAESGIFSSASLIRYS